jgi:lipopolysaccharide export system permease protein
VIIFRYLIKEFLPQFFSTLIIISATLIVSQLVRLSEVLIAFGLSLENILLPFLFIIMPFMTLIIPIAYLFAVMISFSRLSADGEYTALLAAGYSLRNALVPVLLVGLVLYGIGVANANYMEAWGRREFIQFLYRKTQTELDSLIKYKLQEGVFFDGFLGFVLFAEKISQDRSTFTNVMLTPLTKTGQDGFVMLAPMATISGSLESGDLTMSFHKGQTVVVSPDSDATSLISFDRAEVDLLRAFQDQIISQDHIQDDYRGLEYHQLLQYIKDLENDPDRDEKLYARASYLMHSRFSQPFLVIGFALFAMIFGIQDQRRSKNSGYIGTIATLILGYVLMSSFQTLAEKSRMDPILAAWSPHVIIALVGAFFVYQKNRLPPSESLLSLRNLPFVASRRKADALDS